MTRARITLLGIPLLLLSAVAGIALFSQATSRRLKGQTNVQMVFYGRVMDQDEKPLKGVEFSYAVFANPTDWSFDKRGVPRKRSDLAAVSDEKGEFQLELDGCELRLLQVRLAGHHHFCEEETDNRGDPLYSKYYSLVSWGDPQFKSDRNNPAVYVMVKDDVNEVSALPCRGGARAWGGSKVRWIEAHPGWPVKPSLPYVRRKMPTSQLSGK